MISRGRKELAVHVIGVTGAVAGLFV